MAKVQKNMRQTKKQGIENTAKKQEFIQNLVKENPGITMNEVAKRVVAEFKTMIGFGKLREAFVAAGGKISKRGRYKATSKAKPAKAKSASAGRKASVRTTGRRSDDHRSSVVHKTLSGMPNHMVVYLEKGHGVPNIFDSADKARAFVAKLITGGLAVNEVAYYERQNMNIQVKVDLPTAAS